MHAGTTRAAGEPPRSPCQQTLAQPKADLLGLVVQLPLDLDQPADGVSGAQARDSAHLPH